MRQTIDAAVVVSDLHCGSVVGLMPPESENTPEGNVVGFGRNLHQAWLWDCWVNSCAAIVRQMAGRRWALIVNGDATEGIHHRSSDVVAAAIEQHTAMAAQALYGLAANAARIYITLGTECHTLGMENELARKLGAESGKARAKWLIDIHGCLVDATHHMGVTSRAYLEASAMSATIVNAREQSERAGHPSARVYLRGHRHCGGHYSNGHSMLIVTGGWQFLTRHGHKVVPDAIPVPTIAVLDWKDKPHGALPYADTDTYRHAAPEPEIAIA